jgi:hypothetical protein
MVDIRAAATCSLMEVGQSKYYLDELQILSSRWNGNFICFIIKLNGLRQLFLSLTAH